jgi:DNA repair protein RadC
MKIEEDQPMNIKNWAPEDRPREKLLLKGMSALSDAELIAILLGSGTAKLSAVDVAKKVLAHVENNLDSLAKLSVKELMKAKGIGEAKAVTIVAALELGRRRKDQSPDEKPKIESSKTAFELIRGDLMDLPHEEFWVMLCNRANRLIKKKRVSEGGVSGTVADPKIIFKLAVDGLASGIIVVHNHPSGNLKPSESDINLTRKIKEAGKLLEISLLDHLIIAHDRYYSFADEGML